MNVRYQFFNKLSAPAYLAAFLSMASTSACGFTVSKPHIMLETAELTPYVVPPADHEAILRDAERTLRESVSSVAQQRAQQHVARTYGWLSYKKSSPPIQTKVYALRLTFDEVKQRYETTYSAAGIVDGPETHTLDGAGYCALARDTGGAVAWEPVKNQPCFSESCSSQVTSDIMKATCRALNDRVLQHQQLNEPV